MKAINALQVIVLTPHIRQYLAANDPAALAQCLSAIHDSDVDCERIIAGQDANGPRITHLMPYKQIIASQL